MKDFRPFEFGDFSGDDIKKVMEDIKERRYRKLEVREEDIAASSFVGRQFLAFLEDVLRGLGLLDRAGIAHARAIIGHDVREGEAPEEILRRGWKKRASDWAVIETSVTYAFTIETLIQFFRRHPNRRERILSLGSGPGLYETFLGVLLDHLPEARGIRIFALDYAEEMTRIHQKILANLRLEGGRMLTSVKPVTSDMTDLRFKDGSIDQIIVNNSLQWVPEWRKAICEMARVMRPEGLGWLYLFVHTHPMVLVREDGVPFLTVGDFTIPELLDVLEANRFGIHHLRQIAGAPGTGQMGGQVGRAFILAKFEASGEVGSWRKANISAALRGLTQSGEWAKLES